MIRLANSNEEFLGTFVSTVGLDPAALAASAFPRWQPTATKILAGFIVPNRGYVGGFSMSIAVVGAKGSSTDLKCQYRLKRVDQNFGNAVVLTGLATALDVSASPVIAPAAAAVITGGPLGGLTPLVPNDIVVVEYLESGTFNADTRPIVLLKGIKWVAFGNMDPILIPNLG